MKEENSLIERNNQRKDANFKFLEKKNLVKQRSDLLWSTLWVNTNFYFIVQFMDDLT